MSNQPNSFKYTIPTSWSQFWELAREAAKDCSPKDYFDYYVTLMEITRASMHYDSVDIRKDKAQYCVCYAFRAWLVNNVSDVKDISKVAERYAVYNNFWPKSVETE